MTTAEAIEKIKKLLRMKHGGTPEEVAAAIRLAEKIAKEVGINLGSVIADLDADLWTVRHNEVGSWERVPMELHLACKLCERVFDVDFVIASTKFLRGYRVANKSVLNVIGHELDRAIAGYCAIYVARQMRLAWRHKRGRCRARGPFFSGFIQVIEKKLATIRPARERTEALILSRRDYIAKLWPNAKSKGAVYDGFSMPAAIAGARAAKGVDVRRPVAGSRDAAKQLGTQPLLIGA